MVFSGCFGTAKLKQVNKAAPIWIKPRKNYYWSHATWKLCSGRSLEVYRSFVGYIPTCKRWWGFCFLGLTTSQYYQSKAKHGTMNSQRCWHKHSCRCLCQTVGCKILTTLSKTSRQSYGGNIKYLLYTKTVFHLSYMYVCLCVLSCGAQGASQFLTTGFLYGYLSNSLSSQS